MKDYDVLVPMSRLKELEEIENKFNNDEHKVVEEHYIKSNLYFNVKTHYGFIVDLEIDLSKRNVYLNKYLDVDETNYFGLGNKIKNIFNNQSHDFYKCLKIELEDRLKRDIKNEIEKYFKNLPFLQKLKFLFKK
jgi:vacuolar-type H+-ATPase subunit B/Vma2